MHIWFINAEIANEFRSVPLQSEWVIDSTDEEHQGGGVGCIILWFAINENSFRNFKIINPSAKQIVRAKEHLSIFDMVAKNGQIGWS
jgi:hypothetical protein